MCTLAYPCYKEVFVRAFLVWIGLAMAWHVDSMQVRLKAPWISDLELVNCFADTERTVALSCWLVEAGRAAKWMLRPLSNSEQVS